MPMEARVSVLLCPSFGVEHGVVMINWTAGRRSKPAVDAWDLERMLATTDTPHPIELLTPFLCRNTV